MKAPVRLAMAVATAMAVAVVSSACSPGSPGPAPATSTAPPLLDPSSQCPARVGDGQPVRFGADQYLGGVVVGSGSIGIVLGHHDGGNLCEWLPFANELADQGYRVLAFDFAGEGTSNARPGRGSTTDDMVTAAQFLREQGAQTLVLMGASKGGTAAAGAASRLEPPPAGVVALSAPAGFEGAHANVGDLTVPALFIAAKSDGGFAAIASALAEGTPDGLGVPLIVEGPGHGTALLAHEPVVVAIQDFLQEHAPVAS